MKMCHEQIQTLTEQTRRDFAPNMIAPMLNAIARHVAVGGGYARECRDAANATRERANLLARRIQPFMDNRERNLSAHARQVENLSDHRRSRSREGTVPSANPRARMRRGVS